MARLYIHPASREPDIPNLLLNGALRIVDLPGLGASMRLHKNIALTEMTEEDAIIILVTKVDRIKDQIFSEVTDWISSHVLAGLQGPPLDVAAGKVFLVINEANDPEGAQWLASQEGARMIRSFTEHISPNYWARYSARGGDRPHFQVMAAPALYVQDRVNTSELEEVAKNAINNFNLWQHTERNEIFSEANVQALLRRSEIPQLRDSLLRFIREERIDGQLHEAASRISSFLTALRAHYERQIENGYHLSKPYDVSLSYKDKARYEEYLELKRKEVPHRFEQAMWELNEQYNQPEKFEHFLRPVLDHVEMRTQDLLQRKLGVMTEQYQNDRTITRRDYVRGIEIRDVPVQVLLYEIQSTLREALLQHMPEIAKAIVNEFTAALTRYNIWGELQVINFGQNYCYVSPYLQANDCTFDDLYTLLIQRVAMDVEHVCQHVTMYEALKSHRTIDHELPANAVEEIRFQLNDPALKRAAMIRIQEAFFKILKELLQSQELLDGLRQAFWVEIAKAEEVFRHNLVEPMLKWHYQNLPHDHALQHAMQSYLEPLDDLRHLYHQWDQVNMLLSRLVQGPQATRTSEPAAKAEDAAD
jgi:hypothetical protein